MNTESPSPLLYALRCCTVPEQHTFAELAGTKRNYLYQIATRKRKAGGWLAMQIVEASIEMHVQTTGRVPKITLKQLN